MAADMPGADDAVKPDLSQVEDGFHYRRADLVKGQDVVVLYFSCSACRMEAAMVGAVVSKPMPMKTTDFSGLSRAMARASWAE